MDETLRTTDALHWFAGIESPSLPSRHAVDEAERLHVAKHGRVGTDFRLASHDLGGTDRGMCSQENFVFQDAKPV